MPVLNQFTAINQYFDDYALMPNHNDFASMVRDVEFVDDELRFYFFNLGETHYPYMLNGDDLPHISGVHGVFKEMDEVLLTKATSPASKFFDLAEMQRLHKQQISCVEHIDKLMGELFAKCPPNTHIIVTADHGELFGEDDYFGHGPIMHKKCFEVPFLEGLCPEI